MEAGTVLTGLSVLKDLWNKIRGTSKFSPVNRKFFSDNKVRKDFLDKHNDAVFIVQGDMNGDIFLGDTSQINPEKKKEINKIYNEDENNSQVDIIETDFFYRLEERRVGKECRSR